MTDLAHLDSDEMARWLLGSRVRMDTVKVKVPDDEAELVFSNGRLEVRQAGGLVGVFEGTQAAELIEAATTRRRPAQPESPRPLPVQRTEPRKRARRMAVAGLPEAADAT